MTYPTISIGFWSPCECVTMSVFFDWFARFTSLSTWQKEVVLNPSFEHPTNDILPKHTNAPKRRTVITSPSSDPQNVQQTMLILRSKSTNKVCNCTVGPLGIFFCWLVCIWHKFNSDSMVVQLTFPEKQKVPPKGSSFQDLFHFGTKNHPLHPMLLIMMFFQFVPINMKIHPHSREKKQNLYLVASTYSKNISYINWFISPK